MQRQSSAGASASRTKKAFNSAGTYGGGLGIGPGGGLGISPGGGLGIGPGGGMGGAGQ